MNFTQLNGNIDQKNKLVLGSSAMKQIPVKARNTQENNYSGVNEGVQICHVLEQQQ